MRIYTLCYNIIQYNIGSDAFEAMQVDAKKAKDKKAQDDQEVILILTYTRLLYTQYIAFIHEHIRILTPIIRMLTHLHYTHIHCYAHLAALVL